MGVKEVCVWISHLTLKKYSSITYFNERNSSFIVNRVLFLSTQSSSPGLCEIPLFAKCSELHSMDIYLPSSHSRISTCTLDMFMCKLQWKSRFTLRSLFCQQVMNLYHASFTSSFFCLSERSFKPPHLSTWHVKMQEFSGKGKPIIYTF